MKNSVYIALGTNIGQLDVNLQKAHTAITEKIGDIVKKSTPKKSEPWGFESNNIFLNQVIIVETSLSPFELLRELQKIEFDLGRNKNPFVITYQDRVIDLDIIYFNDVIIQSENPELKVPHNFRFEREFVFEHLLELTPYFIDPVYGKTISEILISRT